MIRIILTVSLIFCLSGCAQTKKAWQNIKGLGSNTADLAKDGGSTAVNSAKNPIQ